MKYKLAALGGTFDRFHRGHEHLLKTGLAHADHLIIGITKPTLTTTKVLNQLIEPYEERVANVRKALCELGALNQAILIPLEDAYGPTITNPDIDALVVTSQTKEGGEEINQRRFKLHLPPLPLIETEMVQNNQGEHLSSTQVREGSVTRNGQAYISLLKKDIIFSKEVLARHSQPQGEIILPETLTPAFLNQFTSIWLTGDIITHHFIDHHLPFRGAIIDGKTRKNQIVPLPPHTIVLSQTNPPGTISASVATAIIQLRATIPAPLIIKVDGEEDLLGFIPCLLEPLNSVVFYGQPDRGIAMIHLTEMVKLRIARSIEPKLS